ncbi:MAG: DUF4097 domain-containing protein [bacterium]|nr:DUF4097 domain-containing protein [bacterium]
MKKFILMLLMILFVAFFTLAGQTGEALRKEFDVEKGKRLEVNLKSGGAITIAGWEKEKAAVTVHFEKTTPGEWDTRFDQSGGGLKITCTYKEKKRDKRKQRSSPRFDIRVPVSFDLKLKTMGGAIEIDHVEGEIKGTTMGGALKLRHLKGNIRLKTMGGEITLTDSDLDGKVTTMGGRVLVENVTGDIKGVSMGGNVIYKNVKNRSGVSSGKIVKISTMGGAINVSEASEGADLHTMGGGIHVKSAKKFVKAKTMGGDIGIDAVDGGVKAVTMGGDITVTMTGDPNKGERDVNLVSMGGDITLTVPAGLSMDVDIKLTYTKNAKKRYKIVSDFSLEQEKTGKWEIGKGTPRKYIYGKAKIAGARHKIKIKTVNGNIYLKKSK